MEAVVHRETYQDFSAEDIDKHYREKESMPIYQEFIRENNKETLAQVFTDIRYKKEDNILFSRALLDVLGKQGFMDQ